MKRTAVILAVLAVACVLAPAAFAQGGTPAAEPVNWVAISAGFSMAIASGLCGIAQAKATAHACESLARNPGATAAIRFALVLALILIESMALYVFAIIFLKVK